ncbi:MAG: class I poly(R)-hydroxyalkanoic acid synthase [Comamonas sp. SCN 67-35]|uniref:PHA/PHB synthase family protein n=1 Tax=unclassified Comamonas TaxID=2638500 RepID=UPI00086D8EEF|nr:MULTISPECIES: class I poly(R)-hydroxyalkanoic acid synthase [unclassified Comamonas]MBN9330988.1 class I poly(R)-hydroxyalkanoic acid synthase [Comamonas sp.]ODU38012.1 MAG: class I poly(R)-hydroxyalkanoic acid synthase [Comamonas sp. SCN 67-35]OJX03328.1 MAG: class I poly(R)-hydroxyalkanoic acid synthase [Burkholderiales bacterium 66-26]
MTFDPNWAQDPQKMQQLWSQAWGQVLQSFEPVDVSALATSMRPLQTVALSPEKLARLQQQYLDDVHALWNQSWGVGGSTGGDARGDRRFASDEWGRNPLSAFAVAAYELQARTLMAMVDAVQADEKTRARIRFSVEQFLAASAPSNFLAFNVEAQKKALQTQGESLAQGLANLLKDIQQGHISMTDESRFEVGRNVATTEGAVVFENELLQLIEYKPLTAKVHERPFLMVPPCINKYYILDLQPDNSFIRYAVSQGHRTFVVSWRNPDMTLADKTWDDYIEGAVIKAIQAVKEISGAEKINALGFCVGGTMLSNALAVLAARGDDSVASATFLTTLIDFTETGVLDVFIDENFVRLRELQMGQGGLMKGQDLASTFSFLRPNDLVWNYVVGNYLKGETPPAFDLLYWNCDSTNLPGPYYAWYLRHFYLENKLVQPGALTVCGEKLDLRQVKLPVYVYGSREDHIVPIGGAYASTQLLPGKKRFVMGASGHIAGVINPPAKKKRSHWLREDGQFPAKVDDWIAGAAEHPGSWWEDWAAWLKGHAGRQVAAPKAYGKGARFKAIEPAPGRYVRQRA